MRSIKLQIAGAIVSHIGIGFASTTAAGHLMKVSSRLSMTIGLISGVAYFLLTGKTCEFFNRKYSQMRSEGIVTYDMFKTLEFRCHIVRAGLVALQTITVGVALRHFSTSSENHWKGFTALSLVGLGRIVIIMTSPHKKGKISACAYM